MIELLIDSSSCFSHSNSWNWRIRQDCFSSTCVHEAVKKHFEVRLWACILVNFELKVILKKILDSVLNREPGNLLMNTWQDQLWRRIEGKRYLLLDNIWCENYKKWIDLNDILMGGLNGTNVIVTTRSEMVARTTGAAFSYALRSLSAYESWSLFTQMAFEQGQEPKDQGLIAIGEEIVRKCSGVLLLYGQ